MTDDQKFERAVKDLALRPMLWQMLTEPQCHVMRSCIAGQAFTAIGQTMGGKPMAGALVKRIRTDAVDYILQKQRKLVQLERRGFGPACWNNFFTDSRKK